MKKVRAHKHRASNRWLQDPCFARKGRKAASEATCSSYDRAELCLCQGLASDM